MEPIGKDDEIRVMQMVDQFDAAKIQARTNEKLIQLTFEILDVEKACNCYSYFYKNRQANGFRFIIYIQLPGISF